MDRSSNGSIDRTEFKFLLQDLCIPKSDLETYFSSMDTDGDGQITFDEFKVWYQSKTSPRKGKFFARFKKKFKKRMSLASGSIDEMRARRSIQSMYEKNKQKLKRRKSGLKLNTTSDTRSSTIDFPETPQAVRQEVDKARKQWLDEGKEIICESVKSWRDWRKRIWMRILRYVSV